MDKTKQNYGVFPKTFIVKESGEQYSGAIFLSPERKDCVEWAKKDPTLIVRKLNKKEMEQYNEN